MTDAQNKNLTIWDAVKTTDPAHVKPMLFGDGGVLHSINPNYQIQRATELFGPCGLGWGYEIMNENYVKGAALFKEQPDAGSHTLHVLQVKLWYKKDDQKGELIHFGQTTFIKTDLNGQVIMDDNAPKKSLTDAISKCLSMLGFSADVYSGQYAEVNTGSAQSSQPPKKAQDKLEDNAISMQLRACKTIDELQFAWVGLNDVQRTDPSTKQAKEDMKVRLMAH